MTVMPVSVEGLQRGYQAAEFTFRARPCNWSGLRRWQNNGLCVFQSEKPTSWLRAVRQYRPQNLNEGSVPGVGNGRIRSAPGSGIATAWLDLVAGHSAKRCRSLIGFECVREAHRTVIELTRIFQRWRLGG